MQLRTAKAFVFCLLLCLTSVSWAAGAGDKRVQIEYFGTTSEGIPVHLYTLMNKAGMQIQLTDYGATVVSVKVPDRDGKIADIALGYPDVKGYETNAPYLGVTVGRFANRIANAQFKLDGQTYHLFANDGPNTLHGGKRGFDKYVWKSRELKSGLPAMEFTRESPDGEEGFPGNVTARVTFTLMDKNELKIEYSATTDKNTVVNLTNHSYFNLAGPPEKEILDHVVTLDADRFVPVDQNLIPTGELRPVTGTPFDFTTGTAVGARIGQNDQQLKLGRGYDHCWVVNGEPGSLRLAARVEDPTSGRVLEVLTTEPGIQLYTGNFLNGTVTGKYGKVYKYRYALALETEHFPDSPNQPTFPTTELKPGQTYHSETVYRFSTKK